MSESPSPVPAPIKDIATPKLEGLVQNKADFESKAANLPTTKPDPEAARFNDLLSRLSAKDELDKEKGILAAQTIVAEQAATPHIHQFEVSTGQSPEEIKLITDTELQAAQGKALLAEANKREADPSYDPYVEGLVRGSELYNKLCQDDILYKGDLGDKTLAGQLVLLGEVNLAIQRKDKENYPGQWVTNRDAIKKGIDGHLEKYYKNASREPRVLSPEGRRLKALKEEHKQAVAQGVTEEQMTDHDKQIGTSDRLFFHNGSFSTLEAILSHGSLASHRAILEGEGKFNFKTGANNNIGIRDTVITPSGIEYTNSRGDKQVVSWSTYNLNEGNIPGDGKIMGKDPLLEFDQILFNEDKPYYRPSRLAEGLQDQDWTIIFPQREIKGMYQYSGANDGIHVFDPKYDSDSNSPEGAKNGYPPGKKGAKIELGSDTPFLIAIGNGTRDKFNQYLQQHGDNLPGLKEGQTPEQWVAQHVVYVDSINNIEQNDQQLKEAMFSRFDVPEYKGVEMKTGNKGDTATTKKSADLYSYVPVKNP